LARIESGDGNVSLVRLVHLADALDTSPDALLRAPRPRGPVIALTGLRGAGKSTVGPLLAALLHVPFVEMDAQVQGAAGLPLDQIFELHGERYYRRLERETLQSILAGSLPSVVAAAGGVVNEPSTWKALLERTTRPARAARGITGAASSRRATVDRWRTIRRHGRAPRDALQPRGTVRPGPRRRGHARRTPQAVARAIAARLASRDEGAPEAMRSTAVLGLAVAGSWYPSGRGELARTVDVLVESAAARRSAATGPVAALVVPTPASPTRGRCGLRVFEARRARVRSRHPDRAEPPLRVRWRRDPGCGDRLPHAAGRRTHRQ
jgi:hypothetical protein